MEKLPPSNILGIIENTLKNTKKFLRSKEVICACYLYRFMTYRDDKAYNRFKEIFSELDDSGKKQAISYYRTFVENNKSHHNKKNSKVSYLKKRM